MNQIHAQYRTHTLRGPWVKPEPLGHLLQNGNQTCGAWTDFLAMSLQYHGITVTRNSIQHKQQHVLLFNNWKVGAGTQFPCAFKPPFMNIAPGIEGQRNDFAGSNKYFGDHCVVRVDSIIYDPSYGFAVDSEKKYEQKAFFGYIDGLSMVTKDSAAQEECFFIDY